MATDQIKQRLDDLSKRFQAANQKKSEYRGQLEAKRKELHALSKEIEAAGIDPKNLKKERDRLEAELVQMLDQYERELTEVETALATFEKKA